MDDWLSKIRSASADVRPSPDSMKEIPDPEHGPIAGRAFFPGGNGRDSGRHSDARPSLVIIGNDFGRYKDDYLDAVQREEEELAGTWGGLLTLLSRTGISASTCFFTNAIMGARATGPKSTGPSPGLKDLEFTKRCAEFLRYQIEVAAPIGVAMLGKEQSLVLGLAFPELAGLATCQTWVEIDDAQLQFREAIELTGGRRVRFCALMHPCMRASNMKQHGRQFNTLRDDAAELELLRRTVASPRAGEVSHPPPPPLLQSATPELELFSSPNPQPTPGVPKRAPALGVRKHEGRVV